MINLSTINYPFIKRNIALAWPLACNALLMQSMLMIDTLLISPLGEIPLAAMGIATTIIAFILGIQMALANGTQLILSRAVGSGNPVAIARAFWAGMGINFIVAFLFWLLLSLFEVHIITLLTDNSSLYLQIHRYLMFSKYLVLLTAITQIMIALFNSLRRTKVPLKGYLIEMPINAVLSYFLIHGFGFVGLNIAGLGVEGSAIGSVCAMFIRLAYLLYCINKDRNIALFHDNLFEKFSRSVRTHCIEIFPFAGNMVILSIGATIYQLLYSQLSLNAYVAITLVMPWLRAGTQFITAWAHSSAIMISQSIGSRQTEDLTSNINTSIDVAVIISILCAGCFAVMSLVLDHVYPDLAKETYVALAVIAPLYIVLPIVRGYNTVHGHVLRALGKTTSVFKINFTGQWLISIPLCAIGILYFDVSIFWAFAIQPFEEIVKALPFRHLARKSVQELEQDGFKTLMVE